MNANAIIITGGPGSGKSTLTAALSDRGLICVPEVGRQIIREQAAIGGDAVHTGNWKLYAELMLSRSIGDFYRHMDVDGPVFFDRGIPELAGYWRLFGADPPGHFQRAAAQFRYHPTVFLAPVWQEIYHTDEERKQDFAEAIATTRHVSEACRVAGYDVVDLPKASVAERVDFVLDSLKARP